MINTSSRARKVQIGAGLSGYVAEVVRTLPDLRVTTTALDMLALYRRHGTQVLSPRIDRDLIETDEDVLRACAALDLGAVAPEWQGALWSLGKNSQRVPN